MRNVILNAENDVSQRLLGEFKIQEDVNMWGQLPGYDDFRRLDLEYEDELATVSKRAYGGFLKPP